ncbi:L,D-transpeptidase [Thioalkalivibrio sulfidiphilus]|nr:L,D-transpeptidase [Thioalkalivibrio sulfidiphilus]
MDECPPVPPVTTWYGEIRDRLARDYPDRALDPLIVVRIGEQRLYLIRHGVPFLDYPVSTSRYGIGNRDGSLKTPLGVHQVRRRIGEDAPLGTIFRGRANTGRIANILTTPETSPEDNITSRILWLDGLEEGVNRGGEVDSFQRFIYIHGTDEEGLIGQPASDGCVRMTNAAVIELFDQVPLGTLVVIVE